MTYKQILELYKNGKLDKEQEEQVKADIEKHDAISEYLFENDDIQELNDIQFEHADYMNGETDEESRQFIAMIRSSIRKAFIKAGVIVAVVVTVIVLLVVFVLPGLVGKLYYNPKEVVGKSTKNTCETNRMSLDLAVFSELFWPGYYRDMVVADSEGYGKYAITIPQTTTSTGSFISVGGRLDKNKLTLYNNNILKTPFGNAFVMPKSVYPDPNEGAAGSKKDAYKAVWELDDNKLYQGFISFKNIEKYLDVHNALFEKNYDYHSSWYALYLPSTDRYQLVNNIGFSSELSGNLLNWDKKKYPNLSLLDSELRFDEKYDAADEKIVQSHVESLIKYSRDYPQFCKIMNQEDIPCDEMLESLKKNGLQVYGIAIVAKKDTFLKMCNDDKVDYIYVQPFE